MWTVKEKNKTFKIYTLSRRVMAIAVLHTNVGDWSAYIDAVPGQNHDNEWREVVKSGTKMTQHQSETFFGTDNGRWRA